MTIEEPLRELLLSRAADVEYAANRWHEAVSFSAGDPQGPLSEAGDALAAEALLLAARVRTVLEPTTPTTPTTPNGDPS